MQLSTRLLCGLGKYWEKGNEKRIYFDNKIIQKLLKFEIIARDENYSIDNSTLNGEKLTNEQADSLLLYISRLNFYYDLINKKFSMKSFGSGCFLKNSEIKKRLVSAVKKRCNIANIKR